MDKKKTYLEVRKDGTLIAVENHSALIDTKQQNSCGNKSLMSNWLGKCFLTSVLPNITGHSIINHEINKYFEKQ